MSVSPVESSPAGEEEEEGGGGCIASTGASLKRSRERRRRRNGLGLIRTEAKSNEVIRTEAKSNEEEEDSTFQLETPRTTPNFANTDAEK